ncbi:hypothetical protein AGDE_12812 [Angomonas deanei]|nr:hypothetical protein AGDE_12812 [Angomonas deanei]|eukprot:EPY23488.1 hypothetical protein AGDE_12812 [Angomonas deanei]
MRYLRQGKHNTKRVSFVESTESDSEHPVSTYSHPVQYPNFSQPLLSLQSITDSEAHSRGNKKHSKQKEVERYANVKSRYKDVSPTKPARVDENGTSPHRETSVSLSPEKLHRLIDRLYGNTINNGDQKEEEEDGSSGAPNSPSSSSQDEDPQAGNDIKLTPRKLNLLLDRLYSGYVNDNHHSNERCSKSEKHFKDPNETFSPRINKYYSKGKYDKRSSYAELTPRFQEPLRRGSGDETKNVTPRNNKKMDFNQFLARQQSYEERKLSRLNETKQKIADDSGETTISFSPQISPRSRQLAEKYSTLQSPSHGETATLCQQLLEYVPIQYNNKGRPRAKSVQHYTDINQVQLKKTTNKNPNHSGRTERTVKPSHGDDDSIPFITPHYISPIPYPPSGRPEPKTKGTKDQNLMEISSFYCGNNNEHRLHDNNSNSSSGSCKESTSSEEEAPVQLRNNNKKVKKNNTNTVTEWPSPPSLPDDEANEESRTVSYSNYHYRDNNRIKVISIERSPAPVQSNTKTKNHSHSEIRELLEETSFLRYNDNNNNEEEEYTNRAAFFTDDVLLALAQWWERLINHQYTTHHNTTNIFLHYSHFELDLSMDLLISALQIFVEEKQNVQPFSSFQEITIHHRVRYFPNTTQKYCEVHLEWDNEKNKKINTYPKKCSVNVSFSDFIDLYGWITEKMMLGA